MASRVAPSLSMPFFYRKRTAHSAQRTSDALAVSSMNAAFAIVVMHSSSAPEAQGKTESQYKRRGDTTSGAFCRTRERGILRAAMRLGMRPADSSF